MPSGTVAGLPHVALCIERVIEAMQDLAGQRWRVSPASWRVERDQERTWRPITWTVRACQQSTMGPEAGRIARTMRAGAPLSSATTSTYVSFWRFLFSFSIPHSFLRITFLFTNQHKNVCTIMLLKGRIAALSIATNLYQGLINSSEGRTIVLHNDVVVPDVEEMAEGRRA